MKRILITGANSYIGTSFEKYIKDNDHKDYAVDTIDMVDGSWREKSFAGYDCVFHVAGIAHQKETKQNARLYYEVNRDLAVEVARQAKQDGVRQFIFLSSMSVYGMDTGVITRETKPDPKSHYGKSKWEAEQQIAALMDESFRVCILRPPMVYGKGCKGNFQTVVKIVERFPFFPRVKNARSMIYIDNLAFFVQCCMDNELSGIYFPQNKEYMSTMELAQGVSEALNKKIYFEYITGMMVGCLRSVHPMLKKAFGSLVYNIEDDMEYCIVDKMDSVRKSVG